MQEVLNNQGPSEPPLQYLQAMCGSYGPPLPLGKQLCWILQPKALFAFPDLCVPRVNSCIFPDRGEGWQVSQSTQHLMCSICGVKYSGSLLCRAISGAAI